MCMSVSFGTYVDGVWVPNGILSEEFIQSVTCSFDENHFNDILNKFNIYISTSYKGVTTKIDSFERFKQCEHHVYFYPKKENRIGYKLFKYNYSKTLVKSLYTNEEYKFNKEHTATKKKVLSSRWPYLSGFHIFPRKLDLIKYGGEFAERYFRIHKVEYNDIIHYGLESNGSVVVVAKKMKILN